MAWPWLLCGMALAALLAFAACSPADSPRESAPQFTPQQVLLRAAETSGAQESYRAEINDIQQVTQEDILLVTRTNSTGVYLPPDRLRVATEITYEASTGEQITFQTEAVSIGLTTYQKDPELGEWRVTAHPSTTPLEEIALTPELSKALEFGPDEAFDGERTFHLRASRMDEESGLHHQVEVWIGRSDFLFKQAAFGSKWPEGQEHNRTLRFSDYGESVEIGPPVPEEVLTPITADDLQGEAIDPQDISWEHVTIDRPGRALVAGLRSEDGNCSGASIHLSASAGESEKYVGRWGSTIWSDPERCVNLIEYGYVTEEESEKRKRYREGPWGSSATAVPQPAEPSDK